MLFNEEKNNNFTMIRNLILIIVVLVVGFILIINFNKSEKNDELDKNIYLMITTVQSETENGVAKTTNLGEEKYYKDNIGQVINSNGMNFIIEEFTDNSIVIKLNNDFLDLYGDASCPKGRCAKGAKISLDGSKTITLTDTSNKYSYTMYFQAKK